jgi:hypothetical protein
MADCRPLGRRVLGRWRFRVGILLASNPESKEKRKEERGKVFLRQPASLP